MASKKITELQTTEELKESAHLLVTQPETNESGGESVESARRAPLGALLAFFPSGDMILPSGTCAGGDTALGTNGVSPDVTSKMDGMMILQTFTTDVPQYTGSRILQISPTPTNGGAPVIAYFRDNGEGTLAAGTYLLRYDATTDHMIVVGRMQEKIEGGSGATEVHIGTDEPDNEDVLLWIDTDEEMTDVLPMDEIVDAVLDALPTWNGGAY